ncbi:translation initiation factor IF-3 [Candidatus Gracilibacteria bacterium]|nr:translation initiation factor IF-3 [Candidatus Gracilibacteria bacterium]
MPRHLVNGLIRAPEVRLVDEKGDMLGVMKLSEALAKAHEVGLDVVEISPKARPPVCKIIDYGKFQYEEKKKERIQKKASKSHEIKGIRLSFRIGPGDLDRQRSRAEEFLTEKHPVRIQLVLKGREKAHRGMAFVKMKEFIASLEEFGTEDQPPRMTGFQIISILKPKVGK